MGAIPAEYLKKELKRPKSISMRWNMRPNTENRMLYAIYRLIRIFHVTIWFYPFPFIVQIVMYANPFLGSLRQEE